jgi:hypothetical protein
MNRLPLLALLLLPAGAVAQIDASGDKKSVPAAEGKAVGGGAKGGGGLSDCSFKDKLTLSSPEATLYRALRGWKLYRQESRYASGSPAPADNTFVCVFGSKALFLPGVVGADERSLAIHGDYLKIKTAFPAADASGGRVLTAAQLRRAEISGQSLVYEDGGKRQSRGTDAVTEYYFRLTGLEAAIAGSGNYPIANASKVAWASKQLGGGGGLQVFIHPGEDAAKSVKKAVRVLEPSSACVSKGKLVPALADYIDKALADAELTKALENFARDSADGAKAVNAAAPSLLVRCGAADGDAAVPSWNPGKSLAYKGGAFDAKSGY